MIRLNALSRWQFFRNKFSMAVVKAFECHFYFLFEAENMKRIVILIVLVGIAAVAGVVRSSVGSVSELRGLVSHKNTADVRQEIRQTYELAPGARVELSGLNGAVKIETSDSKTAEIYIERTAATQE